MRNALTTILAGLAGGVFGLPASAATLYGNLTPNNQMAIASRPGNPFEIEAADDFVLNSPSKIASASFVGLTVPGSGSGFSVSQVVVEVYRVSPLDSNTTRTPNVPTRANSPSDVAFDSRDSTAGGLNFSTSTLAVSFTASNSIQAGGIHPKPNQQTLGNGPLAGQEVAFGVTFTTPFTLPADHYFFVPQVQLTNGAQFYWLSASRPISGAGNTPFSPDLQAWTRDANLDPDWLRVGSDIVGGAPPPTFNAAFSLSGSVVPEASTVWLFLAGLAMLALFRIRSSGGTELSHPDRRRNEAYDAYIL